MDKLASGMARSKDDMHHHQLSDPFQNLALCSFLMFALLSDMLFPCKVSTKDNHVEKFSFICSSSYNLSFSPNCFSQSERELLLVQCNPHAYQQHRLCLGFGALIGHVWIAVSSLVFKVWGQPWEHRNWFLKRK